MDLPPDKMRTLRNCDLKKKWDLVCDQRKFSVDHSVPDPSIYLEKLKIYMDRKTLKKVFLILFFEFWEMVYNNF